MVLEEAGVGSTRLNRGFGLYRQSPVAPLKDLSRQTMNQLRLQKALSS